MPKTIEPPSGDHARLESRIFGSFSPSILRGVPPLTGMLGMAVAFWFYAIAVILVRVRANIPERERTAQWVGTQDSARPAVS